MSSTDFKIKTEAQSAYRVLLLKLLVCHSALKFRHAALCFLSGMLASTSSDDAKQLSMFAKTKNLPFVSYTASAPELSNVGMYSNFMRTVAPDGPLTQVH